MSNEDELLKLAKEKFGELSPADIEFFTKTANGEIAVYGFDKGEENDTASGVKWGDECLLKADRIAWLCTDKRGKEFVTHKGIRVLGARIEGRVDLQQAILPFSLFFMRVFFTHEIILLDAEIRALNLTGTQTKSILADGLRTRGVIFLRRGCRVDGEVRLNGAEIGGNFECDGSEFISEAAGALYASAIKVKGGVYLRNGFKCKGEVRLMGAEIGGDLICSKGEFSNAKGNALNAQNAVIVGNVVMRDNFIVLGDLCFTFVKINGGLQYLDISESNKPILDLRSAKVGTLYDNENSWPAKGNLLIDGFEYDIIADKSTKDSETRLKWLRLQPEDQFRPQPYEQLAKVLEKMGHENDARKIRIAKNNDRLRIEKNKIPWYERYWLRLLGKTISYGYRPLKAIPWMTGVIMLGIILFGAGYEAGVFSPLSPTAYITDKVTNAQVISPDYPTFNVLAYSFNEFVPLINLRQGNYWMPNANKCGEIHLFGKLKIPISGSLLRYYLWVHIVAGWVLTSLLVAGLSGLVRK